MLTARPSAERGHVKYDWLDTSHTFSFDTYYDPGHMGFRTLRVINEDHVAPGHGFPLHHHANMEVLTIIISGHLRHEDDLGHGSVVGPWEVQRFSAGTGIRHAEYNPSDMEEVHLLQIWILPERNGLKPSYEQKRFDPAEFRGRLGLIASRDGRDGSVTIHQDANLYRCELAPGQSLDFPLGVGRGAWVQVIGGDLIVNGAPLSTGDGAAVEKEPLLRLETSTGAFFVLFDLG